MASQKIRTSSRRYALAALLLVGLNINVPVVNADPIVTVPEAECNRLRGLMPIIRFPGSFTYMQVVNAIAQILNTTTDTIIACKFFNESDFPDD